jgi:hypothetical protein
MSESPKESDDGYAEEQPDQVTGDGENERRDEGEHQGEGSRPETESGDGKATGNPRSAG